MASLVNPPGYAAVKLIFRLPGDPQDMVITFGVKNDASFDAEQVADGCAGAFWLAFEDMFNGPWVFVGAEAQLGSDGAPGEIGVSDYNEAGSGSTPLLPQNCALLVHKRTALGGREGRGRMYMPTGFLTEGDVDGLGNVATSVQNNANTRWATTLSTISGLDIPMVLLHGDGAILPTLVSSIQADPVIATQRRRLRR